MSEFNPYQPPRSEVAEPVAALELAGRGVRLGAAFLDGLLLLLILLPLMIFGGYIDAAMEAGSRSEQVPFGQVLGWTLVGFVVFVLLQGWPLHQYGQTWAKRWLGIRIVDMQGNQPSLATLLGRRYLPMQAINAIPLIGGLLSLVDVLLIFREDRRCAHDLIAGTQVVRAR